MQIEYNECVKTRPVVLFLMSCRDQVASTADIAKYFDVAESTVRSALNRLLRVQRVAEIHPHLWHLE